MGHRNFAPPYTERESPAHGNVYNKENLGTQTSLKALNNFHSSSGSKLIFLLTITQFLFNPDGEFYSLFNILYLFNLFLFCAIPVSFPVKRRRQNINSPQKQIEQLALLVYEKVHE